eukprot:GHVT01075780.1.p1 GENE.GHVT01075780.1~~GHVT01075780.1.p1  ORF type:complete len:111 (+),score=6.72 GHVT01075780.1:169-501(+)
MFGAQSPRLAIPGATTFWFGVSVRYYPFRKACWAKVKELEQNANETDTLVTDEQAPIAPAGNKRRRLVEEDKHTADSPRATRRHLPSDLQLSKTISSRTSPIGSSLGQTR